MLLSLTNGHYRACPTLTGSSGCTCEQKRYALMFCVGLLILVIEGTAGYLSGSLSLIADASHLATDISSDAVAWCIAAFVISNKDKESKIRSFGGYLQASLLFLLAYMIFTEALHRLDSPSDVEPWTMIIVGTAAAFGNWWRHKILHSGESHDHNHVTHMAQVFHVATDFIYSILVAVGGVFILITKNYSIDLWFSFGLSGIASMLALYTLYLALKGKDSGCGHHHH